MLTLLFTIPKVLATMTDNELIDELGGTAAVAKLFEVKDPSISGWRKNGIPKARMQTLKLMRPDLFQEKKDQCQKAA